MNASKWARLLGRSDRPRPRPCGCAGREQDYEGRVRVQGKGPAQNSCGRPLSALAPARPGSDWSGKRAEAGDLGDAAGGFPSNKLGQPRRPTHEAEPAGRSSLLLRPIHSSTTVHQRVHDDGFERGLDEHPAGLLGGQQQQQHRPPPPSLTPPLLLNPAAVPPRPHEALVAYQSSWVRVDSDFTSAFAASDDDTRRASLEHAYAHVLPSGPAARSADG